MTKDEALGLALGVLKNSLRWPDVEEAIAACEQALEETPCVSPEQEPVAWRTFDGEGGYDYRDYDMNEHYDKEWAERNPNHAHWVDALIVKEKK